MNYLKYIWSNPFKLAYVIFISLVVLGCTREVIIYWEYLNIIVNIALCTFIAIIYLVAIYHPYKEWKDGLNSDK